MKRESTLTIVGDVKKLIDGEPLTLANLDHNSFCFALGAVAEKENNNFGEALIWNAFCHQTLPDEEIKTQKINTHFTTPFLMGMRAIPKNLKGHVISPSHPLSLQAIYESFADKDAIGYMIIGFFEFSIFEGAYLKKAPINKESLMGDKFSKHFQLSPSFHNQMACTFGVIIPKKSKKALEWRSSLVRGFYSSPMEKNSPVLSHTHVMLYEGAAPSHFPNDLGKAMGILKKKKMQNVYHLLPHSCVQRGVYFCQKIDSIQVFPKI